MPTLHPFFLALAIASPFSVAPLEAAPRLTVLSTDIGGDIDDTWALAHLLRSPELDLRMVLTETGEAEYRALVPAKLLELSGRSDVTIALGPSQGIMEDKDRHQGPWVMDYQLDSYPGEVRRDGVQAFIELVRAAREEVVVIAIGPVPSLAQALEEAPDIAGKCHFYGMHGAFDLGYGGSPTPEPEYNVYANVPAFRSVMGAAWKSIAITPLDTCGIFYLDGEDYHAIWSATHDPLLRSVIENYCIWAPRVPWMNCDFFATRSSTLFDDVAVYLAYSGDLVNFEEIRFSVADNGLTYRDSEGPFKAKVATSWKDLDSFKRFYVKRLLGH